MNGKTLLETYPKAAEVIRKHFMEKLLESLNDADLPDDFKEFARQQDIDNDKVGGLIDAQPRGLFDVLDSNSVYIEILVDLTKDDALFSYVIDGDMMGNVEGILYNSRIEAEKVAIEKAFQLLNDKL
jgi:hypothetical protein